MVQLQPMLCPRCGRPLHLEKHRRGGLWRCSQCSGVAANMAVLRKHLEVEVANDFWRRALQASAPSTKVCPSCSRSLGEFIAVHEKQSLRLDLCRRCQLMWFDPGEMEVFPKSTRPEPSENAEPLAMPQIHTEPGVGDFIMDENENRLAYYVEVSLTVVLALLRLFR